MREHLDQKREPSIGDSNELILLAKTELLNEFESKKETLLNKTYLSEEAIERNLNSLIKAIDWENAFLEDIIISMKSKIDSIGDPKSIIVLRDIDDTLTKYGGYELRASFKYIDQIIKTHYPTVQFGICSARGEEHIRHDFYPKHKGYFNKDYLFSAREEVDQYWGKDKSKRGEITRPGYAMKINAYDRISKTYPDKNFILIDDVIDERFEQLRNGIVIRDLKYHLISLIDEDIPECF